MPVLRFGSNSVLQCEFPNGAVPLERGLPLGEDVVDVAATVTAALEQPLDYPALALSTTPGDRVVVALDHSLPRGDAITAAVVNYLERAGVDLDGISVLRTHVEPQAEPIDPCRLLDAGQRARVKLLTHDPADRVHLAYLAATSEGEPILLNRALQEADVVVPVGRLCRETAAGYFGIHGAVYPGCSDSRTQARYRSLAALQPGEPHHRLEAEANEAAWLLGVNITVQIVPGHGEEVRAILAGAPAAVLRRGMELYHETWQATVPGRVGLVVAAIEGGAEQQTWENLGRAVGAALQLVEDGGAIAVCCELDAPPGPAVQSMAEARNRRKVLRRIGKHLPYDSLAAAQLARALDQGRLYLLSRLDPGLCELLDIVPVAPDELQRLMRRTPSCVLLSNAPHAMVTVENE